MFTTIVLCVSAFYIQTISCQVMRNPLNGIIAPGLEVAYGNPMTNIAYKTEYANPWTYENYGLNLATLAASNGCGFTVQSSSPIVPNGVSILSENMVIEGPLAVNGHLPFLGTIGLEGALPAAGAGVVSYGCGNGNVGITNEGYNMAGAYGLAPKMANLAPAMTGLNMAGINTAMYGVAGY